jgi:putative PIN family toxin of toxin-antitoxin system
LIGVAARPKFDRFVSRELRGEFVSALREKAELIVPTHTVIVCRDPKDDAFLSLAVSAEADAIITGDPDLLTLHPFEDIPILTPRQFLERVAAH